MSLVQGFPMPTIVQDRTQEFKSAVASISRINGSVASHRQAMMMNGNTGEQDGQKFGNAKREFAKRASEIAKDISETTEMLQRLALLAKRKTLFDDRPVEITELTYVIKQKVSRINESIADLQKYVKSRSKANPWGGNTKSESQINEHSKNVVILLQGKLSDVTTGFAEVLEVRTKNIQATRSRTEQFISSASSSVRDTPNDSPLYGAGLSRGHTPAISENPYANSALDESPYHEDFLALPEQQQQMALLEEQQDSYLSSRSTAVESIEKTIQELGGIFSQLATMVAEQGETVQRIDANTEDISLNISGAHRELLKYYARISSNRWLMIKAFGVVIFFFLLWVLVS